MLPAIVAIAAALRFATLGLQSFDADEAFTVHLARLPLGDMLSQIPKTESMPPLHYVLAWAWTRVVGSGEIGIRSLSALCGTLTVPIIYAAARVAFSRRAGLIAAAIATVNPILVWYSQEARPYALLLLFSAASLYYFLRAREQPSPRLLLGWAVCAGLALVSHYFAVFVVVPEAAWLVWRTHPRRPAILACLLPTAVAIALAPLAYAQRNPGIGWFTKFRAALESSLGSRLIRLPRELLLGFKEPTGKVAAGMLVVLSLYGLTALARDRDRRLRAIAVVIASVAATAFLVPIAAALLGPKFDFVDTRNLLGGWVPVLVLVAGGLAVARRGMVPAAVFVAVSMAMVLAVATDPAYQRPDARDALAALGRPQTPRMVLFTGGPDLLVADYVADALPIQPVARVGEIDVVALPAGSSAQAPSLSQLSAPVSGFSLAGRRVEQRFTLLRFTARTPKSVVARELIPGNWKGWTRADLGSDPELVLFMEYPPALCGPRLRCVDGQP